MNAKLQQATSKADLMKVEIEHLRRELQKEQPEGANPSDFGLAREEAYRLKQKGGSPDEVILTQKMELEAQKHALEIQRMQLEVDKLTAEKTRLTEDLNLKKAELETLKSETQKTLAEAAEVKAKMDQINKENDAKILQLKTDSEKHFLEAERKKVEAASHKQRLDELYPKLDEMTRNQGSLQRQITELEAMNHNLSMRLSMNEQQYRLQGMNPSVMNSGYQFPVFGSGLGDFNLAQGVNGNLRHSIKVGLD